MLVEQYFDNPDSIALGTRAPLGTPYISVEEVEIWLGHSLPPSLSQRNGCTTKHQPKGRKALLDHLEAREIDTMLQAIKIDGLRMSDMDTPSEVATFYEQAMEQIGSFIEASIHSGLNPDDVVDEFKLIFS